MRASAYVGALVVTCVAVLAPRPAAAQAPGEPSAYIAIDCDRACLIGFVRNYMQALAARDPAKAHLATNARFTENNVELPIGKEGLWATVTGVAASGLEAADPTTGEAAWIGAVEENGLPVYYGMRMKVRARAVVEVETVVVRQTGLPLPFGDVTKLVHDPAFAQELPEQERRPRERLVAVAQSYFNTVELNDGMVFAPFDDDCSRIENGILTTSGGTGSSGDIAQGCEKQFKLGIYRINKRIRERRYPLVDVERGIVVATGFFDHANEFDRYKTTDGVERKTLLKWPNSISLVEAFRIRNGKIQRIEAVFTYVPYFMHSPFYRYPTDTSNEAREADADGGRACDKVCLTDLADRYMRALIQQKPATLPWAKQVKYSENGVSMMIGEGIWGSARNRSDDALRIADPESATVLWYGVVFEHDAPSYFGLRLKVRDQRIAEVEALVARARNPGPFGDATKFKVDKALNAALARAQRPTRERLGAAVKNGAQSALFATGSRRIENGADVTAGETVPVDRFRGRRVIALDTLRGLVATVSLADYSKSTKYPSTRELLEIFKLHGDKVQLVEAISVFQPYGMPSAWATPAN